MVPLVAMADREMAVMSVDRTHIRMIAVVCMTPAWAQMDGRRRKRMMFRMDWMQGRNTPLIVFCFLLLAMEGFCFEVDEDEDRPANDDL